MCKKELFDSYYNSIKRMDLNNVKPYTETELQPLYSDLWVEKILIPLIKLDPKVLSEKNFVNVSVIRSMLIMDLMDCTTSGHDDLKPLVFEWYSKVLDKFYKTDKFSLKSNKPISSVTSIDLEDYTYFGSRDVIDIEILNLLFELSYKEHHDIYADNGYEVLGPYNIKSDTFIIYSFNNKIDKPIKIIQYGEKGNGTIDLFGHCNISFPKTYTVLEVGGEIIYDEKDKKRLYEQIKTNSRTIVNILKITDVENNIIQRLYRYYKLLPNEISGFTKVLYDKINGKELLPRITEHKKLLKTIKF